MSKVTPTKDGLTFQPARLMVNWTSEVKLTEFSFPEPDIEFTDRNELAKKLCLGKRCAEIGVSKGEFAKVILKSNPSYLMLVDVWQHQDESVYSNDPANMSDKEFETTYCSILSYFGPDQRVEIVRNFSVDASRLVPDESLDFVYIDANHSTAAVYADMIAWWPKLKKEGWFCGHDFSGPYGEDVSKAVRDFMSISNVKNLLVTKEDDFKSWAIYKLTELE